MSARVRHFALAAASLALAATTTRPARATGMQGHTYMAMCAAEQLAPGRVKTLLLDEEMRLINGAFFPDSGYTNSADHDQGEIPHWEEFVEAWVEAVRAAHPDPWADPAGRARIAQLLGLAAHGITDSTFDSLFYDRVLQVDPGGEDALDMSMDVFLVADLRRELIPELAHDATFASTVFSGVKHPVPDKAIEKAMSAARSGMAAVVKILAPGVADFAPKYPWARASLLRPDVPGSYPFGARVALGYYRELEKRIDGDPSADGILIGHYPEDALPLVTLDHTRADARIALFFGIGLDRKALDGAITLTDASGEAVPAKIAPYRGDTWANAVLITPSEDWAPDATYTVTVKSTVKTLHGASPSKDLAFTFSTHCATAPGDPACKTAATSACPKNDARFQPEAEEPDGTGGGAGAAGAAGATAGSSGAPAASATPSETDSEGGCAVGVTPSSMAYVGSLAALAALVARRRRVSASS